MLIAGMDPCFSCNDRLYHGRTEPVQQQDMVLESNCAEYGIEYYKTMNTLTSLISLLIFPAGLTLLVAGMLYEWIDRKLVARFQNRIGPRWFQPMADMVKLFAKEQITAGVANPFLFFGLPSWPSAGALTAALYVPLLGFNPAYSFPGDLIVTIYLLSLLTMCIGLAGWNTSSRFCAGRCDPRPDAAIRLRSALPAGVAGARPGGWAAGRSAPSMTMRAITGLPSASRSDLSWP